MTKKGWQPTCIVCRQPISKVGRGRWRGQWDGLVGHRYSFCDDSWCKSCYEKEQQDVLQYATGPGMFSRLPRYMIPKWQWPDQPPYAGEPEGTP